MFIHHIYPRRMDFALNVRQEGPSDMWWKVIVVALVVLSFVITVSNPLRQEPLAIGYEKIACENRSGTCSNHSQIV